MLVQFQTKHALIAAKNQSDFFVLQIANRESLFQLIKDRYMVFSYDPVMLNENFYGKLLPGSHHELTDSQSFNQRVIKAYQQAKYQRLGSQVKKEPSS